ncbi:lytic transglycosylase domain-containing protein [Roseivirga pacifica]|uniref:lytic transglycosylase domain-containing protein n=1 Tax=Roseivirga pacifica TaxID=1267423 RepID=UPI0020962FF8|nr:lytic transglycosylase domain-containing protein [Roseivirga pacifica]MCO6357881.1 LysM peptidoglycan-binding domain-containing protein [Roseivirga pacifica]MCO6366133.1 LysM peptidoglycan-binding domain-containing protein [Roseivirga pacifica]MCO6371461.1 LysM peptidoglycan-binding domain-containing protein [Roseivirga pacifica]MCO6375367.1 LysM peptidoglycan-binding domain-containing protein [Roseivirga pacifica]MCO6378839.1 LysM peptidoglycan-binding domain-containing protein [Roseivirga
MRKVKLYFLLLFTTSLAALGQEQELALAEVYDYAPDFSYEEIERRYNNLGLEIDIAFNDRVDAFINYFTVRERGYTREMLRRKEVYFPIFEKYLAEYKLPQELKYLPIIESGLNPGAVSRPKAVGLWQFMAPTGKEQGLKIDWYIDERMDPEKATEAACKYIAWLYRIFDDWKLTLAAYNSGIGNVQRAIRRAGNKHDFWEVYRFLPRETRSYVPQFAAVLYTMEYADEHNLYTEEPLYPTPYEEVEVNQFVYLKAFAEEGGMDLEELRMLNPSIKKDAIPENAKNFKLRVPVQHMPNFELNRETILAKAADGKTEFEKMAKNMPGSTFGKEKVVYRVRSGDVLGKIALKYNVRVTDIRAWNNLRGSMIRVGQRLTLYTGPDFLTDNTMVQRKPKDQPIPASKVHVVQPGDTLWDISRMYKGLSIEKLKTLNNLKNNQLKPGMKLKVG